MEIIKAHVTTFVYTNLYVFNARVPFRLPSADINMNLANWRKTSYIGARELFSLAGFFL